VAGHHKDGSAQPGDESPGVKTFGHLAQKLFNVPLFLKPEKAELLVAALAARFGLLSSLRVDDHTPSSSADVQGSGGSMESMVEPGYELSHGLAVIDIRGTLVQRTAGLRPDSGMTGYDAIRRSLYEALDDPDVHGICLSIDSPGGEAAGCLELVNALYAVRGEKPCWAILSPSAGGGAYAIASTADRIIMPETGDVGSLGPILIHIDWVEALNRGAVNVSMMQYRSPAQRPLHPAPLHAEDLLQFQERLDAAGDLLIQAISRHRSLSSKILCEISRRSLTAAEARATGLVDDVMPPDAAFRALLGALP